MKKDDYEETPLEKLLREHGSRHVEPPDYAEILIIPSRSWTEEVLTKKKLQDAEEFDKEEGHSPLWKLASQKRKEFEEEEKLKKESEEDLLSAELVELFEEEEEKLKRESEAEKDPLPSELVELLTKDTIQNLREDGLSFNDFVETAAITYGVDIGRVHKIMRKLENELDEELEEE